MRGETFMIGAWVAMSWVNSIIGAWVAMGWVNSIINKGELN